MAYMQHRQDPFMGSAEEMGDPMPSMGMPMPQPSYQPQQQAQQTLNQVAPMTMATMPQTGLLATPPPARPLGQPIGVEPQQQQQQQQIMQQQLMRAAPMTMSTMQPMQPMPGPTAQPIGRPPGFAPTMSPAPVQEPGGGEGGGHQIVHAADGGMIPQYGMGGLIGLRGGGTVPMIYSGGGYIPGYGLGGFFKGLGKFALKAAPYAAMFTPGGPWASAAVAAATGALEKKLGIDQESWGDVLHGRTVKKKPTSWREALGAGAKRGITAYAGRKLGDAAREGWKGPSAEDLQADYMDEIAEFTGDPGAIPGAAPSALTSGSGWRGALEGVKGAAGELIPSYEDVLKYGPLVGEIANRLSRDPDMLAAGAASTLPFPGHVTMPKEIMPRSSAAQGYSDLIGVQEGGELDEFEEPMHPFMAQLSNTVPNTMASMPTLPQGSNGNLPTNPFMDELSSAVPNTMGSMNTEDMLYGGGGGTGDSYDPMLDVPQVGMFSTGEQKAAAEAQKRQDEANAIEAKKKAENPYGEVPAEVLSGEREMTQEEVDKRAGLIEKEMDRQKKQAETQEEKEVGAARAAGKTEETYPQKDNTSGMLGVAGINRKSNLGPAPWENVPEMPEGYRAGLHPEGQLGSITGYNPFDMPTSGFGTDADAFLERLKGGSSQEQPTTPQWQPDVTPTFDAEGNPTTAGVKGVQAVPPQQVPGSADGGPVISTMDTVYGGEVPPDYQGQSGNVDTKLAVTLANAPMTPEDVGMDTREIRDTIEWALLNPVEGQEFLELFKQMFGEQLIQEIAEDIMDLQSPSSDPNITMNDREDRLVELETRKRLAEGEPVIPQAMVAGGEMVINRFATDKAGVENLESINENLRRDNPVNFEEVRHHINEAARLSQNA